MNMWASPENVEFEFKENAAMEVKFKRLHRDSVVPSYAKDGDAGLDLTATHMTWNENFIEYGTGIAVEIPYGYVGLIFPRSSVSKKDSFYLKNSVGVIDSGYRGEIKLRFNLSDDHYQPGEKIGQLIIMPYPKISLREVDELSDSERGDKGFGSSGF